jgi:hypothetical protein
MIGLKIGNMLPFSRELLGLAGITEHVRDAALQPLQEIFQGFQGDVLLSHFHSMKR